MILRFTFELATAFAKPFPRRGRPCHAFIIAGLFLHRLPQSGPQILRSKCVSDDNTASLSGRHPPIKTTSAPYSTASDSVHLGILWIDGSPASGSQTARLAPSRFIGPRAL